MKPYTIEIRKVTGIDNAQGLIRARVDAGVSQAASRDDNASPGTVITLTEDTARVLLLLLKAQLAEFDARKAKSRR